MENFLQVMLGLQQQHEMFANMSPLESSQKMDGSPMHHQDLSIAYQANMEPIGSTNGVPQQRKKEDVVLLQSQNLNSTEIGNASSTTSKKNEKKKGENNGVKKKKTRYVLVLSVTTFPLKRYHSKTGNLDKKCLA